LHCSSASRVLKYSLLINLFAVLVNSSTPLDKNTILKSCLCREIERHDFTLEVFCICKIICLFIKTRVCVFRPPRWFRLLGLIRSSSDEDGNAKGNATNLENKYLCCWNYLTIILSCLNSTILEKCATCGLQGTLLK